MWRGDATLLHYTLLKASAITLCFKLHFHILFSKPIITIIHAFFPNHLA